MIGDKTTALLVFLRSRRAAVDRTLGIGWKCARCGTVAQRGDHHGRTVCTFTRDGAVISVHHIDTSKFLPPSAGYRYAIDTDAIDRAVVKPITATMSGEYDFAPRTIIEPPKHGAILFTEPYTVEVPIVPRRVLRELAAAIDDEIARQVYSAMGARP